MVIKLGLLRGIEGSGIMSSEFLEVTGSVERRGCKTGFLEGAPLIMGLQDIVDVCRGYECLLNLQAVSDAIKSNSALAVGHTQEWCVHTASALSYSMDER